LLFKPCYPVAPVSAALLGIGKILSVFSPRRFRNFLR
jgi:hypothetical protein